MVKIENRDREYFVIQKTSAEEYIHKTSAGR
jgi:hypothetical protein